MRYQSLEKEHRAKTKFASQPAEVVILFVAFFVGLGEFFCSKHRTTQNTMHDDIWQTQIMVNQQKVGL